MPTSVLAPQIIPETRKLLRCDSCGEDGEEEDWTSREAGYDLDDAQSDLRAISDSHDNNLPLDFDYNGYFRANTSEHEDGEVCPNCEEVARHEETWLFECDNCSSDWSTSHEALMCCSLSYAYSSNENDHHGCKCVRGIQPEVLRDNARLIAAHGHGATSVLYCYCSGGCPELVCIRCHMTQKSVPESDFRSDHHCEGTLHLDYLGEPDPPKAVVDEASKIVYSEVASAPVEVARDECDMCQNRLCCILHGSHVSPHTCR